MAEELNTATKQRTEKLKMSVTGYTNSLKIQELYRCKWPVTKEMVHEITNNLPAKSISTITPAFRAQIKSLPVDVSWSICNFIVGLNLTETTRITSQTMGNIWVDKKCLFYMAFGKFHKKNIKEALYNYKIVKNIGLIGDKNTEEEDFIYISNFQRFTKPHDHPKWEIFLSTLNLPPDTTIIKTSGKGLVEILLPVIQKI